MRFTRLNLIKEVGAMMTHDILYIIKAQLTMLLLIIIAPQVHGQSPSEPAALNPLIEAPRLVTIQDAFEKALMNDLQIQLANNRLALSKAQKISGVAELLPKLKSNLRYTKNIPESKTILNRSPDSHDLIYRKVASLLATTDKPGADALEGAADRLMRRPVVGEIITKPAHVVDATLSLVIPLFNGIDVGRIGLINENIRLLEAQVNEQRAQTLYQVAQAYLNALYFKELIALRIEQSQKAALQHEKIMQRQKRGLVSIIEQLKSEQAGEELHLATINAQFEYNQSLADLGFLIGETHSFDIDNLGPDFFTALDDSEEALLDFARANRPDLLAQAQALKVAERERVSGVLQFLPIVSLQADANYTTNTKGLVNKDLSYAIFLNAHYDFFSGGSTIGALKESSLKKQAQTLRLNELNQRMGAQIRGQRANIERARLVIKTLTSQINYTTKLEQNALIYYGQGRASIDLVIDARTAKYEAERALKKAQADERLARLSLAHELGLLTPHHMLTQFDHGDTSTSR